MALKSIAAKGSMSQQTSAENDKTFSAALDTYSAAYDNALYNAIVLEAVKAYGMESELGRRQVNAIMSEVTSAGLSLCGSPYHECSAWLWYQQPIHVELAVAAFLSKFVV